MVSVSLFKCLSHCAIVVCVPYKNMKLYGTLVIFIKNETKIRNYMSIKAILIETMSEWRYMGIIFYAHYDNSMTQCPCDHVWTTYGQLD